MIPEDLRRDRHRLLALSAHLRTEPILLQILLDLVLVTVMPR
ncbi:MAG: hypothetical protein AVDCRST_MAG37-2980 [uncultured Rubrobacteraceae bacterium]|uniref:Uncharacterized protein n=1 Tax=uncultured Rubrobacteraceae bacterium TaxID=349277 RepID=A0A6J4QXB7_9ACTN|nr:MAG: hypothetical protein AVDCRST_MAG37-2980 [uncultured Rubrobacteraceae bacterium]